MINIDNLLCRRPVLGDVEALLELKNNEKASYLLAGQRRIYKQEDIVGWIEFHNNNPEELLLVIEDTDACKLIGHIGLYKIDHIARKAEIGILIADDGSRGKGYGTKLTKLLIDYAFMQLRLHKVTAEVLKENVPSLAMFKKCGFSVDGCMRDDVYKNDRYYDVISLSILSSEYYKND